MMHNYSKEELLGTDYPFVFLHHHLYLAVSLKTQLLKKVNRKVQEEAQVEAAATTKHQEEEKKWHRLTCA